MQNKQQEFQNSWNQEEQTNNDPKMTIGEGKMWRRGVSMRSMISSLRLRTKNHSVPRELVIPESCLDKKTYSMSIHAPLSKNYTDRSIRNYMAMMLRTLQCGIWTSLVMIESNKDGLTNSSRIRERS